MKKNKTKKFFGGKQYIPKYDISIKKTTPLIAINEMQSQQIGRERQELEEAELRNRTQPLPTEPISQEEINNIFVNVS